MWRWRLRRWAAAMPVTATLVVLTKMVLVLCLPTRRAMTTLIRTTMQRSLVAELMLELMLRLEELLPLRLV